MTGVVSRRDVYLNLREIYTYVDTDGLLGAAGKTYEVVYDLATNQTTVFERDPTKDSSDPARVIGTKKLYAGHLTTLAALAATTSIGTSTLTVEPNQIVFFQASTTIPGDTDVIVKDLDQNVTLWIHRNPANLNCTWIDTYSGVKEPPAQAITDTSLTGLTFLTRDESCS